MAENTRLNQECETQLSELQSMAEEVRKVTLQREAYEQRIAEVKDMNSVLKREIATMITEHKEDSRRLQYVEDLETRLQEAQLNISALT